MKKKRKKKSGEKEKLARVAQASSRLRLPPGSISNHLHPHLLLYVYALEKLGFHF